MTGGDELNSNGDSAGLSCCSGEGPADSMEYSSSSCGDVARSGEATREGGRLLS